jgi:hypothetical protein
MPGKLSKLLRSPGVAIVDLTAGQAQAAGKLCRRRATRDGVDASVVVLTR